jgi:hypothetical protein
MYNHSGIITGNHLGHSFQQHTATGQIVADKSNVLSVPFNKDDIDFFKKRNNNYIREIAGYDHDTKKYKKIEHTHPTIMLNNLQNYNPTQGITYFEPHETDKLFHHPETDPRYENEYVYDVSISEKINEMRKKDVPLHRPERHSFKLKPKYRT